ncbi:MAG: hypothetical protein OZSIB_3305 [Candidatus Ozemobacter sibiricus]|uniref:Prepilin-type N-terminal cleavage/methylation domain-containing protein n=1 Tax=Candidatus Ozemobacter sibiricus TaxID=2268124 RepID=A0A367ZF40_9BACT|nr:MAG: hypothetical protein OZSIB_3305 [Candidatus Ozemobacter sibiricus]
MRRRDGLTLPEVLVALVILAAAVFPLIRVFGTSYALTSKQAFQEQGLKIAEAALAKLMGVQFELLDNASTSVDLPFEVIHASGSSNGKITLQGSPALGSGSVDIGRVRYDIQVQVFREFSGPAGSSNALMFHFFHALPPADPNAGPLPPPPPPPLPFLPVPPPGLMIATYSCPDCFLRIAVTVSNPESQPVRLATFRADLRR